MTSNDLKRDRQTPIVSAIILAAGESKRMGQPKMLLPWQGTCVLGHIISILKKAGLEDILVITGAARGEVQAVATANHVKCVFNPDYAVGEMLSSIQIGLRDLARPAQPTQECYSTAALICLGDQPQILESSVRAVLREYTENEALLIVPSYQMRRGHPWLVARRLWDELLALKPPRSAREFLKEHATLIKYVELDTPSVILDLDTLEDYRRYENLS
jgi:molybdenum cofactor cytidylyltransferase